MKSFLKSFSKKMNKKSVQNYTGASIFPVLSADQLVPASDQKSFLKRLNERLRLPDEHFDVLYGELLTNFIEYVQILPSMYGGHLGSMIYEGMHRAHLAIKLLYDTSEKEPEPLYTYAVFSMALLLDIKHVMSTQKVMISDDHGNFEMEWCPFTGSMIGRGEYFKLREYAGHREAFLHSINAILAEDLLPDAGKAWLYSDTDIFDMWISVLTGHSDWAGKLGHLLKILLKQLEDLKLEEVDIGLVDVEGYESSDLEAGEKFLEWLKEGLEDGSISVNEKDSMAHMLEEGMWFDVPEIFHAFNNTYASFRDWIVVQKQFNNLGLPMLSGYDYKHMQYFSEKGEAASRLGFLTHKQTGQGKEQQGMIIKDKGLLFKDKSKMPGVSEHMKSGKINWKQSAQLPKLSGSVTASAQAKQTRGK